jgi:hypothetical protein
MTESPHPPAPKQAADPLTVFEPGKVEPDRGR